MSNPPVAFHHDGKTLDSFKNLYLGTRIGQLDCLSEVLGVGDFSAVEKECVEINLNGVVCRVISLDALIVAKSAMNRERDKLAAEQLRRIKAMREKGGRED